MQTSLSTRDAWTIEDRQRLLRLRQTFSVLSWRRFHKLRLFPRRSESALAAQWSFIQRQRTQLGITDGDDEADNGGGLTPEPDNNEGMGGVVSDLDRARSATDGDQEVRESSDTRAVGSNLDAGAADRDGLTVLPRSADATVPTNARSSTKHRNGIVILKLPPRLLAQQLMDRPSRASVDQARPTLTSPRQRETYTTRVDRPWTRAMTFSKRSQSSKRTADTPVQKRKARLRTASGKSSARKRARVTPRSPRNAAAAPCRTLPRSPVLGSSSRSRASTRAQRPAQSPRNQRALPEEPQSRLVPLSVPLRSGPRAALSAEAHNEREPYTPAPDPAKENIGETLRRFCSREANKHTELRDEIQELQNQGHAIIDRITKLEEQAAKARRNSDRAQMFLQRPDMFLTLDTSRLHSWMRTMDTSEPQDSSTLQTNGDDGHVDEKRAIVLDD